MNLVGRNRRLWRGFKGAATIVLVAAFSVAARAAQDDAVILARLSERLHAAAPDAVISTNDTTLSASFQTMTFKIHGRSMTGEIAKEAHDEVGPAHDGFLLRASATGPVLPRKVQP